MKLFEVLKAGWQALDDEGKARVISEVTPNGIFREIVMSFDQQFQDLSQITRMTKKLMMMIMMMMMTLLMLNLPK